MKTRLRFWPAAAVLSALFGAMHLPNPGETWVGAAAVVVSYHDTPSALKVLAHVREHAPQVPVIVRTPDERDLDVLRQAGAAEVVPETVDTTYNPMADRVQPMIGKGL